MSSPQTKCSVCGGNDMNLVDGYYYCVECGTQDMTMQQTLVEVTTLADGTYVIPKYRKTLRKLKENVQMAPEWHKWHTYNFILSGLADELIAAGAKPSFKFKVLWIWTRYMKKYHQKIEDNDDSSIQDSENDEESERDTLDENETENEKEEYEPGTQQFNTDIRTLTMGVLYAICYIALNLDENDIQLSDLCRFIREEKVSHRNFYKFIPKGLDVNAIPKWRNFVHSSHKQYLNRTINSLSFILLKKLDLGSVKVPDFHKIVDKFITELCLPKDIKNIVFALAKEMKNFKNYFKIYFLDYEVIAMAYILMAMKLCFGLDDDYEVKLSDSVEKINNDESHIKAYTGIDIETERLFSFREWYNYVELRKIILSKYNPYMAVHHNQEVDDDLYVYEMKHSSNQNSIKVRDKILMEILDKINPGADEVKFSKIDFKYSLTPLTSYTETLLSYTDDPNLKLLLSEDFSAYSINYITGGMDLRVGEKNILIGVSKEGKIVQNYIKGNIAQHAHLPETYVRNCENKNWLVTKPPKQEHITETKENINNTTDDNGDSETTSEIFESKDTFDTVQKLETSTVLEEDPDFNIFDDSFKDIKDEYNVDQINECLYEEGNLNDQIENALELSNVSECNDQLHNEKISVNNSSHVSKLLNKNEIIRALIERKCQEFNIPLPYDMKPKHKLKRKSNEKGDGSRPKKNRNRAKVPVEITTHEIISSYITKSQNDFASALKDSWRNSFRDSLNQNSFLENASAQENSNKTEIDANSMDEIETEKLSSCGNIEHNDNDSVIIFNDEVVDNDQEPQSPVPKDNPEFNENVYNIDQLYVKMKDRKIDEVFLETDSQLLDILDKNVHIKRHVKNGIRKAKLMKPSSCNSTKIERLKPLINLKYSVQKYRYWKRHYADQILLKNRFVNQRFEDELDELFPKSFTYVLRLCASILEHSTLKLYIELCKLEKLL